MRIIVLFVSIFALSGCAQIQQRERQKEASVASTNTHVACHAAYSSPALDSLRTQIPEDSKDATIIQLSDDSRVRPDQKDAVIAIEPTYAECFTLARDYLRRFHPAASQPYEGVRQDTKLAEVALWNGTITFGQFNTAMLKMDTTFYQTVAALEQRQYEVAQRMELQRQQNLALMMPLFLPKTPTTTNCSGFGNSVSCTTR